MLNNDEQKDVRVAGVGISISIKGEISGSEDLTIGPKNRPASADFAKSREAA